MSSLRGQLVDLLVCVLPSDSEGGDSNVITLPTQHPQEFRQRH
jgi:hypothetical protein